jgi:hypothetical protein
MLQTLVLTLAPLHVLAHHVPRPHVQTLHVLAHHVPRPHVQTLPFPVLPRLVEDIA